MKIRDDMEELRRLGAMFNVSTHETADHGQSGTKELRLHNPDAAVFIRYGIKNYLLKNKRIDEFFNIILQS